MELEGIISRRLAAPLPIDQQTSLPIHIDEPGSFNLKEKHTSLKEKSVCVSASSRQMNEETSISPKEDSIIQEQNKLSSDSYIETSYPSALAPRGCFAQIRL